MLLSMFLSFFALMRRLSHPFPGPISVQAWPPLPVDDNIEWNCVVNSYSAGWPILCGDIQRFCYRDKYRWITNLLGWTDVSSYQPCQEEEQKDLYISLSQKNKGATLLMGTGIAGLMLTLNLRSRLLLFLKQLKNILIFLLGRNMATLRNEGLCFKAEFYCWKPSYPLLDYCCCFKVKPSRLKQGKYGKDSRIRGTMHGRITTVGHPYYKRQPPNFFTRWVLRL